MASRRDQGTRSLHCRGYDTTRIGEKELRDVFATFGRVIDVYLPKDYFTKKVRGFAYIQFEREPDADAAREKLDRSDVFGDNRIVNIMWAAGDRKTPHDMRRLDVERDNPHARRAVQRTHGRDWQREWDRDRDRLRRDRGGAWDRPRRPWDGRRSPRSRSPPDRSRGFGYGGRRSPPRSRSPPRHAGFHDRRAPFDAEPRARFDGMDDRDRVRDRDWDRDRFDDRDRPRDDYGRKRARSPSPPFDRRPPDDDYYNRRRRRRSASRSPPPFRRRSGSPHRHPLPPDHPDRPRHAPRSRTPSPRKDRSPYDRKNAAPGGDSPGWERRNGPNGDSRPSPRAGDDLPPKIRSSAVAPKLRSAPLSPVETTPPSPESR